MPLLPTLKSETAEQHRNLENGLDLFNRAATPAGYRALIQRFHTLYQPLEDRLAHSADWAALGWDFEGRRKTPWLHQDLRALGLSEADITVLPDCGDLPPTGSLGAAVGCLYVLEGSTLGGQFISRRLSETLAITPETGGRFFSGYGGDTGPLWKEFGAWAENLSAQDPAIQPAAVASAKFAFDCFSHWFDC